MSNEKIERRVLVATAKTVNIIGRTSIDRAISAGKVPCEFGVPFFEAATTKGKNPYSYSVYGENGYTNLNDVRAYLTDFRRVQNGDIYALISPIDSPAAESLKKALNKKSQTFSFAPRLIVKPEYVKEVLGKYLISGYRDFLEIISFDLIWD